MILEAAIVNLTRNLDLISQKDGQSVSSHVKLKEEALTCLIEIIDKAPISEFQKFLQSENHDILVGYLLNVLCQLAKNDKSKSIRGMSLSVILSLIKRLENIHDITSEKCSISILVSALPGVSSALFRIIMCDTKLPKNLLVVATKTLNKFIATVFLPCQHELKGPNSKKIDGDQSNDIFDNLAARFSLLFEHVMNYSSNLAQEILFEVLNLCETIVCRTREQLLERNLKSVVKYVAFVSSTNEFSNNVNREIQLRIMLIIDFIRDQVQNCDTGNNSLESVIISRIFKVLDDLDENCLTMLPAERFSELSILHGLLRLLPQDSLTTLLEVTDRRSQLLRVFIELVEFDTSQPFLFLTGGQVSDQALETCTEKIYTVEKRFVHLNDKELSLLNGCCELIGRDLDWMCLNYIIKSDLCKFPVTNNLFITHSILKGCLQRSSPDPIVTRFTKNMIEQYVEHCHQIYITLNDLPDRENTPNSQIVLAIVIAIESLVTLVELHLKFTEPEALKVVILRTLLCPLLNWASSTNRAISEASLNSLTSISLLYGNRSTKALIEANIDYIVDGVMHLMDNFVHNSQVTNVLAITFKLSSIENFYYFKDVYERVFKILAAYHHTEKSRSIAILFYRTVSIMHDWKEARDLGKDGEEVPLKSESSVKAVIFDLDIDRRLKKLWDDTEEASQFKQDINNMKVTEEDEKRIIDEVESGDLKEGDLRESTNQDETIEEESKKEKSSYMILTEKILNHCINLISSNDNETKILALKTTACGFRVLREDEDTLLPLVHQFWAPLVSRLNSDYRQNLEINLCAFECLVSMASCAKDFIMRRTLDNILPRLCLFLESQASESKGQKDYGPYCMSIAYKCQLRILTHLGALSYHIQLAYSNLWRIIRATLIYLDSNQVPSLREAARTSLHYIMALDADCVWYFAKKSDRLSELPFEIIYESVR